MSSYFIFFIWLVFHKFLFTNNIRIKVLFDDHEHVDTVLYLKINVFLYYDSHHNYENNFNVYEFQELDYVLESSWRNL